MSTLTNDTPCNENLLADQAALASQIYNPIPPYPTFFSTRQCGGALSGASFPLYFSAVNCDVPLDDLDSKGIPPPENNCLRVINAIGDTFNPTDSGVTLSPLQVNVLPGGFQKDGTTPANNVFVDPNARLKSFYCPPQYRMYFYVGNPMTMTLADAAAQGFLEVTPNELQSAPCLTQLRLGNGDTFFDYEGSSQPNVPPCVLANCDCGVAPEPDPTFCKDGGSTVSCPGVQHHAPYFVVVRIEEYADMIEQMCADNRQISLGPPSNKLNRVWTPRTQGCDTFMSNLCQSSDLAQTVYKETCSCFTQQQALNIQYGVALDVPVCCFGKDPSGDIQKSCAFNTRAYKTEAMVKNCCSFAECQQVISQSHEMRSKAEPPGQIVCNGQLVNFPSVTTSPVGPIPSETQDNESTIPVYSWVMLGIAIALLLTFIILLLFVKPDYLGLPPRSSKPRKVIAAPENDDDVLGSTEANSNYFLG